MTYRHDHLRGARRRAPKRQTWLWACIAAVGAVACVLAIGIAAVQSRSPEPVADRLGPSARHDGGTGDGSAGGAAAAPRKCTVSALLVPSCGVWWGATPGAFGARKPRQALSDFEQRSGRTLDIYHAYHRGAQLFPTADEIAIARQPGRHRMLLLSWKPDDGQTWAQVANGSMDAHIDRLAAHIKATFPEKFWLAIHHEPEDEVKLRAGSGYTPDDYKRMFRHVVQRLRGDGVRNAVFTAVFQGYSYWTVKPWFPQLYPGDDVVDWLGYDVYATAGSTPDFAALVDKASPVEHAQGYPGFYTWSKSHLPGKPLMIAEWGMLYDRSTPASRAAFFDSVRQQLGKYPRLKAMVYFEATAHGGLGDSTIHKDRRTLTAFQRLGRDPQLNP